MYIHWEYWMKYTTYTTRQCAMNIQHINCKMDTDSSHSLTNTSITLLADWLCPSDDLLDPLVDDSCSWVLCTSSFYSSRPRPEIPPASPARSLRMANTNGQTRSKPKGLVWISQKGEGSPCTLTNKCECKQVMVNHAESKQTWVD